MAGGLVGAGGWRSGRGRGRVLMGGGLGGDRG